MLRSEFLKTLTLSLAGLFLPSREIVLPEEVQAATEGDLLEYLKSQIHPALQKDVEAHFSAHRGAHNFQRTYVDGWREGKLEYDAKIRTYRLLAHPEPRKARVWPS